MKNFLLGLFAVLLVSGCKGEESMDPALENLGRASGPVENKMGVAPGPMQQMPGDRPMMPPQGMDMPPGEGSGKVHKGEVLETMDATRYTYVKLKTESGEELWSAIPQAKVAVGQKVEVVESIVMKDFASPTLKRTFPTIVFGTLKGDASSDLSADKKPENASEEERVEAEDPPAAQ